MNQDLCADATGTVFGKTPYAFLQEVTVQNRGMAISAVEIQSPSHTLQNAYVSTITVSHFPHTNIVVTGPPASGKQAARHAAAVEVFRRLRLSKAWLIAAQVRAGGKKWLIPDESFLPMDAPLNLNKFEPSKSSSPSSTSGSPIQLSPTRSPTKTNSPISPSSPGGYLSTEWISRLITYCSQKKKYVIPDFKEIAEEGPSNARIFTIQCEVDNFVKNETIKSVVKAPCKKQLVKQMAAQSVLMKLKAIDGLVWDGPPLPAQILELDEMPFPVRCQPFDFAGTIQCSPMNPPSPVAEHSKGNTTSHSTPSPVRSITSELDKLELPRSPDGNLSNVKGLSERNNEPDVVAMSVDSDSSEEEGIADTDANKVDQKYSNFLDFFFRVDGKNGSTGDKPCEIKPNEETRVNRKLIPWNEYSKQHRNPEYDCRRSFDECFALGRGHVTHAVIRDLKMNENLINALKRYTSVSGTEALKLLDEIVRQQPLLPKERTDYLEGLRGHESFQNRKPNDNRVWIAYDRLHSVEVDTPKNPSRAGQFKDEYTKLMDELDNVLFKGEVCVTAKFHHQATDFLFFGFGSNFDAAKEVAAKRLVEFFGLSCKAYR